MKPRPRLVILALSAALLCIILPATPAASQPMPSAVPSITSLEMPAGSAPHSAADLAQMKSSAPLLEASPAILLFLAALALLVTGFVALTVAQKRNDEGARKPLLLTAIGSLLSALLPLATLSGGSGYSKPIALIPPSETGAQVYCLVIGLAALATLGRSLYAPTQRTRLALPLALGALGILSYTSWLTFQPHGFIDRPSMYRSYLLAKYPAELGYDGLYRCTVKALSATRPYSGSFSYPELWDPEAQQPSPASPQMESINGCPARFSPQRWIEFASDVSFFDSYLGADSLDQAIRAPLPAPSPAWVLVSRALVRGGPPSERTFALLALLDPLLLAVSLAVAGWAFGLEALCLAVCFLGAFYPGNLGLTGGSLLGLDWLALAIIGLSLLRKGAAGVGGFLLAWAALIKILPVAFLLPLAFSISSSFIRQQKIDRLAIRASIGALIAVALLIPLSSTGSGETAISLPNFLSRHSQALSDPQGANIGLSTLLSFRPKDLIPKPVKLSLSQYVPLPLAPAPGPEAPLVLLVLGSLLFVGLWCWSLAAERRLWALSLFGFALVPLLAPASAASYSLLLVAAFLAADDRKVPLFLFVALCVMQLVALGSSAPELRYPAMSLVALYFCSESILTHRLALRSQSDAERQNL